MLCKTFADEFWYGNPLTTFTLQSFLSVDGIPSIEVQRGFIHEKREMYTTVFEYFLVL